MNHESLMRKQLPGHIYNLLKSIGDAGDVMNHRLFVVGGFVRDLLIGRPNLDVDIVSESDGIAFAQAFAQRENGSVKRHERFGTAVVRLPDGFKIDVATVRAEDYAHPGALPSVKSGSIKEDLRRRDFTVNAMAIELNEGNFGNLVDFFGGLSDLESNYIRILHDRSFEDDPTRILRAIRFEQRYGFSLTPQTEVLLRKAIAEGFLKKITGQRLRNEILLMLEENDPIPALRRMEYFGLTEYIHVNIQVSDELAELFCMTKSILRKWKSKVDPVLVNLMVLLDQLQPAEADSVSERLVLRKKYAEALKASKSLSCIFPCIDSNSRPSEVYEALKGIPLEVLIFAMAKAGDKRHSESIRDNISSYLVRLCRAKPLLNGKDLQELGYAAGPLYKEILDKTFAAQLDGEIADKDQAISFVKKRFPR